MITNAVCASFSHSLPPCFFDVHFVFPLPFHTPYRSVPFFFLLILFFALLLFVFLYGCFSLLFFFLEKEKTFNETKKKSQRNSLQVLVFAYTFVFTQNPSQRLLPAIIKLEQILIDAGLCRKSFVERTLFGEKFESPIWIRQKTNKKQRRRRRWERSEIVGANTQNASPALLSSYKYIFVSYRMVIACLSRVC